jgi:hypothetical protein
MKKYWHRIWICKCGHCFGSKGETRFTSFGFNYLCPSCGEDVGSNGSYTQCESKIIRWVRKVEFNLLNPKTWFSEYKEEIKQTD